jgi:hypothetical protein
MQKALKLELRNSGMGLLMGMEVPVRAGTPRRTT